jgi:hypothetical protein
MVPSRRRLLWRGAPPPRPAGSCVGWRCAWLHGACAEPHGPGGGAGHAARPGAPAARLDSGCFRVFFHFKGFSATTSPRGAPGHLPAACGQQGRGRRAQSRSPAIRAGHRSQVKHGPGADAAAAFTAAVQAASHMVEAALGGQPSLTIPSTRRGRDDAAAGAAAAQPYRLEHGGVPARRLLMAGGWGSACNGLAVAGSSCPAVPGLAAAALMFMAKEVSGLGLTGAYTRCWAETPDLTALGDSAPSTAPHSARRPDAHGKGGPAAFSSKRVSEPRH